MKFVGVLPLIALATASAAQADCVQNFNQEGVPLVSGITYRSWTLYPKLDAKVALKNLTSAVAAEGFSGIRVEAGIGAISALQETSGSGRPQTLRIVARKTSKGTRVDGTFFIQPGQLASADAVRNGLCRILEGAD